ncbi:hypothetical protein FB451DRAFT_1432628 [Mycena latifolia]|nr:hypothetical protein FB451DRAFT_1432628 [Mycena latifolia]
MEAPIWPLVAYTRPTLLCASQQLSSNLRFATAMFFKILAPNLVALTIVHAAPPTPQVPLVSSNIDLGAVGAFLTHLRSLPLIGGFQAAAVPDLNTVAGIESGIYHIINVATQTRLWCYGTYQAIFVSSTLGPRRFGLWEVERADNSSKFKISNVGLDRSIFVGPGDIILPSLPGGRADLFTIQANAPGESKDSFIVSVPNENSVWSISTEHRPESPVMVAEQNGGAEQLWEFVREKEE